jgi:hypothetical protein
VGAIFRHRQGWKLDWELCCRLARWKHVYVSDYYVDKNHVWSLYFNISSNQLLYSLFVSLNIPKNLQVINSLSPYSTWMLSEWFVTAPKKPNY